MKEEIIKQIILVEGGYVNDPSDSGGETNMGITIETARMYGYRGPMMNLPEKVAFTIYEDKYWNALRMDAIVKLSKAIAAEVVDTGVNMGVRRAGNFLQRSLNLFGEYNLAVDGLVGSKTVSSLENYLDTRSENVLNKMLNCLQGAYYVTLAERREKDRKFIYGWFRTRVSL